MIITSANFKHPSFPLQTLATELSAFSSELASQGPKVISVLGSESVEQCVDGMTRVLAVVQAALTGRERQLRSLQQESEEKQVRDQHEAD